MNTEQRERIRGLRGLYMDLLSELCGAMAASDYQSIRRINESCRDTINAYCAAMREAK